MGLVLFLMAGLWVLGWAMKTPKRARFIMIGLVYVVVVIAQLVLPETTPIRVATGGDVRPWLVLGGAVGLVVLYVWGLKRLRRLAPEPAQSAPPQTGPFREAELNRYARHIVLRELGGAGQRKLKEASVLVIGAGGLGSPALLYLAAAGVGTIGVIDDDSVDGSNLQRQIIHRDRDIDTPKVFSAQAAMQALNPFIMVKPYHRRLTAELAADLFAEYDLILDGSDNFDTRYMVNRAAVATGMPLISGAITQWEGQISLYHPASGAPCYECLFPARPAEGLAPSCAEAGVVAPLPGIIGSQMALEAIKEITGAGQSLRGRLMLHDALYGENRVVTISRRPDCACCGSA
ncbi:MAG: sulfur carrier protein adenylyltransferase ThiF [Roseibaca calidilacus]|uniref:Molybdopterin-synthase adenylyltransferase n=1 Tax=Roseibaca calidilacus TaxID=1666912 RepID=A0A0P8AFI6_9RHOB|nr:HesA/MoeB/ThiF family protein [Roseibaca calidilacus]KPP93013.1 MAG: sulfur carrier protein adenylyltransferase ThiF [Roseibaca calidilacus]CUX80318.1 Molybdopterin or thiamine biosynthesis adenylyltransferase [Roseibaca calidilacus]